MPYKAQPSKEEVVDPRLQEMKIRSQQDRQRELMKKFNQNIKKIILKMKKMRVTM